MYENYYYIDQAGQRQGPLEPENLRGIITPNTLVWTSGMANWLPAGQVGELAFLFGTTQSASDTPEPPTPPSWQQPQAPRPQESWHTPGYGTPQPERVVVARPSSYIVWSILTTLFICLPFGIVAIVYSSQVMNYNEQGLYDEAEEASRKARKWNWISLISILVIIGLYIASIVFIGILVFPISLLP